MKLSRKFTKLPLECDIERLRVELSEVKEHEWRAHPNRFVGNSAALLVSVGGGQNDKFAPAGGFAATPLLGRLPYVRQIMACFQSPISRSRLMRLAPRQVVPVHDDVGWHWFRRIRVHIPIETNPGVLFSCDDAKIHMAPTEVWVFDNFANHGVENNSDETRVHLVIDVVPTKEFFSLIDAGFDPCNDQTADFHPRKLQFDPTGNPIVPFESHESRTPTDAELHTIVKYIERDVPKLEASEQAKKMIVAELQQFSRFNVQEFPNSREEAFTQAAMRLVRKVGPYFLDNDKLGKTDGKDMLRVLVKVDALTNEEGGISLIEKIKTYGLLYAAQIGIKRLHKRFIRAT